MSRVRRWSTLPRALWVLAMWLGATFLSEAHHYTVRHVVCPEHGELIDERAPSTAAEPVAVDQADSSAPGFDGPHACDTPPLGPVLPAVLAALGDAPPAERPAAVAAPRAVTAGPSPLSRAPKTSPPRG